MSKSTKTKAKAAPEDVEAGRRLKTIRKRKNVSQEKLGALLNVTYQQIQKYESGNNKLSAKMLYDISKHFSVPMEYFFDKTFRLNDNRLSVKSLISLGSHEFEHIEESFERQFYKHIDWAYDAIEAGIKFHHDQAMANAHYMDIRHVSTKRIILMSEQILRRLKKAINDDAKS